MKVISISLYGDEPLYVEGAIENAYLAQKLYPGWQFRVYTDTGHDAIDDLKQAGATVYQMGRSKGATGMFWRFLAASCGAEHVIFRDADSRLNQREAAAVSEWIVSGQKAHVMRDHDDHRFWPMLGGMWGVRGDVFPNMREMVNAWPSHENKLDDMRFLAEKVWPVVKDDCLQHSSVDSPHGGIAWPDVQIDGFVGEIVPIEPSGSQRDSPVGAGRQ